MRNDSLVDKIVFRKIQGLFGGRMKWMLTGINGGIVWVFGMGEF